MEADNHTREYIALAIGDIFSVRTVEIYPSERFDSMHSILKKEAEKRGERIYCIQTDEKMYNAYRDFKDAWNNGITTVVTRGRPITIFEKKPEEF